MSNVREHILQTTCDLMEKQGYHGTGLNEIVKESGAPKGSLYHYFPEGKEQIASEAVLQSGKATAERIQNGLSGNSNAAKAIHEFILNIADHVESSGFAAALQTAFKEKLLESGLTKIKAEELGTFITAAVEGGIILSRTHHSGDPLRTVAKHLKVLLSQ